MKIPKLLFYSWRSVFAIPLFLLFIVNLFFRQIYACLAEKWRIFSGRRSVAVVVGLVLLWGLMVAIYERDRQLYSDYKSIEEQYKPGIRAIIDEIVASNDVEGPLAVQFNTFVIVVVSIRNVGEPTGLENWKLEVDLTNGRKLEARPITIPAEQIKMKKGTSDQQHDLLIKDSSALDELAMKPITKGAILRGILLFDVPIAQKDFLIGSHIVLTFNDVFNNGYSISQTLTTILDSPGSLHLPGLDIVK